MSDGPTRYYLSIPVWATGRASHGVSDDGTVIAGEARNPSFQNEAFVWTQSRGSESLLSYLTFHGVSVPGGWRSGRVSGISAYGRTFVGVAGPTGGGNAVGFVATVPTPTTLAALMGVSALATRRRR